MQTGYEKECRRETNGEISNDIATLFVRNAETAQKKSAMEDF